MIYNNGSEGAELLGRASRKKRIKKIARGLSTFAPGGLLRAAARKIRKSKKGKSIVRGFARGAAVGAATGIPGAGVVGLMIAAAKRRKKQRADAAKKKKALGVVPVSIPSPVVAPVPGISSVSEPVYSEPEYDQDEQDDQNEQDDQDEQDDQEENEFDE